MSNRTLINIFAFHGLDSINIDSAKFLWTIFLTQRCPGRATGGGVVVVAVGGLKGFAIGLLLAPSHLIFRFVRDLD